jgi:hypothetical protein
VIDPEKGAVRWDDDLTFTATRWELHEVSLVSVPADPLSGIRSLGSGIDRAVPMSGGGYRIDTGDIAARMMSRQRMHEREQARLIGRK